MCSIEILNESNIMFKSEEQDEIHCNCDDDTFIIFVITHEGECYHVCNNCLKIVECGRCLGKVLK